MSVRIVFFLMAAVISGCSSFSKVGLNQVIIADGVKFQLSAPNQSLVGQTKRQLLTLNYKEESHQLVAQLEFTEHGVILVGLSAQGLPLFEIVFVEGKALQQKQYIEFEMLPLATIISDIQLVYWPLKQLDTSLSGAEVVEHHQARVRNVFDSKGNLIISIIKGTDNISYQHFQRGYRLTITSLEQ